MEELRILGAIASRYYSISGNNSDNHINISYGSNARYVYAYGENGNDTILGGSNDQTIDTIYGGKGTDKLYGKNGRDNLYGDEGNDILYGGNGNDFLSGSQGNDRLYGNSDSDYLRGYTPSNNKSRNDRDILTGGAGRDTFELAQHSAGSSVNRNPYAYAPGYAVITDFNRNEDKIRLTWKGNMDGFSLGVGDSDRDGRNDDTYIYYGSPSFNNIVGIVENNTGLSLNRSYFY